MRKASSMAFVVLLAGVGIYPDWGTTALMQLSLSQLVQGAETIVLGTVAHQESAWNATHTAIYTDVVLHVEETMKGAAGSEVTFRIAGGEVGDIGMRTSTAPTFYSGEQVIVFLHTEGSTAQIFGLQQGKFTVSDGTVTQGGQAVPVPDFRAAIRATSR